MAANNLCEMYGQIIYGDQLSYEELLDIEGWLIRSTQDLLVRAGGEFIDFNPFGDGLMFQCALPGHKLYICRKVAMSLAEILPDHVDGRLLFVEKSLETSHLYWIQPGSWQEEDRTIPTVAPEHLKKHQVTRINLHGSEDDNLEQEVDNELADNAIENAMDNAMSNMVNKARNEAIS